MDGLSVPHDLPTTADLQQLFDVLKARAAEIGFDVNRWKLIDRNGVWQIRRDFDGQYLNTQLPPQVAGTDDPETTYNRLSDYIAAFTAVRNLRSGG